MPMYTYEDTITKKTIDVLRDIENIDVKPLRSEVMQALEYEKKKIKEGGEESSPPPLSEKEYEAAVFRRIIGQAIRSIRAPGWGAKGHW